MATPEQVTAPARGRPRDEKARIAILDAAAELLLARGLEKVSMDAVAEQAGASKATIYRWWPTKEQLALDAVYRKWAAVLPEPNRTGRVREDLVELIGSWSELAAARPYGRVITALLSVAQSDPEFAQRYREHFVEPRRGQGRDVLHHAVETGQLPAGIDVELSLDLLYGAVYHRLLHGHAPIDAPFVRGIVETVCAGLGAAK
jgi:AcrR family transcriptional regulator